MENISRVWIVWKWDYPGPFSEDKTPEILRIFTLESDARDCVDSLEGTGEATYTIEQVPLG